MHNEIMKLYHLMVLLNSFFLIEKVIYIHGKKFKHCKDDTMKVILLPLAPSNIQFSSVEGEL